MWVPTPPPAHGGSARSLTQPGQQGPWHLAQDAGGIPCWVPGGEQALSRLVFLICKMVLVFYPREPEWVEPVSAAWPLPGCSPTSSQRGQPSSARWVGCPQTLKVGRVRSEHGAPLSGCSGLRTGSSQPTRGAEQMSASAAVRGRPGRAVLGAKAGRDADGGGGRLHTEATSGSGERGAGAGHRGEPEAAHTLAGAHQHLARAKIKPRTGGPCPTGQVCGDSLCVWGTGWAQGGAGLSPRQRGQARGRAGTPGRLALPSGPVPLGSLLTGLPCEALSGTHWRMGTVCPPHPRGFPEALPPQPWPPWSTGHLPPAPAPGLGLPCGLSPGPASGELLTLSPPSSPPSTWAPSTTVVRREG